jgi:hypothetical protein
MLAVQRENRDIVAVAADTAKPPLQTLPHPLFFLISVFFLLFSLLCVNLAKNISNNNSRS